MKIKILKWPIQSPDIKTIDKCGGTRKGLCAKYAYTIGGRTEEWTNTSIYGMLLNFYRKDALIK